MLDTFDSIGPVDQWKSGLGRLFLGTFIMLFTYAVLNVFISIISQAWEEVHFEALVDGSPPDQLLPGHRFSRKAGRHLRPRESQMHMGSATGDGDGDSVRCVYVISAQPLLPCVFLLRFTLRSEVLPACG